MKDMKFIETVVVDEWEIETDNGWSQIDCIGKTIPFHEWEIETDNGLKLLCADTHIIFDGNFCEKFVKNLCIGDKIITKSGISHITKINQTGNIINMFDLQLSDSNHRYYTNDILSHNSIWCAQLAKNIALNGSNVLLVSLEMSIEKIFKRIGSDAFNIPIDKYTEHAASNERMLESIKNFKEDREYYNPVGNLYAKKFTSATVADIRAFKKSEEDRLGIKFDALVLDYFTELENAYGTDYSSMYIYHKQNSNDLFNFAGEEKIAVITPHQLNGLAFGADDIFLTNMGESKGIIHRVDNIIAIIQPPGMRLENKMHLKYLKARDSGFKGYRIPYNIDYNFMRIIELGEMINPDEMVVSM